VSKVTFQKYAGGLLSQIDSPIFGLVDHIKRSTYEEVSIGPERIFGGVSTEHPQYIRSRRWANELTQNMRQALTGRQHPQYILYPLSGYDLATALPHGFSGE
jgi:hypothetical protein